MGVRGTSAFRLAIIAGSGRFPLHVAQAIKRQGHPAIIFAIHGWADPALAAHADIYEELAVGALGALIDRLKAHQVKGVVLAGKVTKAVLFNEQATFDAETLGIMRQAGDMSVNGLLGAVAMRLAREGIQMLDSSAFLKESLCPNGVLTKRKPSTEEEQDIRVGIEAARKLASLDIGQTVVIKHGVVVAVEALEGTDVAIRRANALAGSGLVVVKFASPSQDRRFDLPIVGTDTINTLSGSGVVCMAVTAGTTLLLDRKALVDAANMAGISLVGVEPVSPA